MINRIIIKVYCTDFTLCEFFKIRYKINVYKSVVEYLKEKQLDIKGDWKRIFFF